MTSILAELAEFAEIVREEKPRPTLNSSSMSEDEHVGQTRPAKLREVTESSSIRSRSAIGTLWSVRTRDLQGAKWPMDDFIINGNIKRFARMLKSSHEERERKVLRDLLAKEIRKLGQGDRSNAEQG